MISQCRERPRRSFEMMKIFREKMMKVSKQIYFARGLCHSLGNFGRPFRDRPDSFYLILGMIFPFLTFSRIRLKNVMVLGGSVGAAVRCCQERHGDPATPGFEQMICKSFSCSL